MGTVSAFSVAPFDGKGDFAIWQQKMKSILVQQKCFKAIDDSSASTVSADKRAEIDEFAYSAIILNLSDSVIRRLGKHNSAKDLWEKLEETYTETSLPNKLFLLEFFFRYKLDLNKVIDANLDVFTKLIQDIKLTGDKNIDDYTPIVLLNVIPDSYSDVKSAIKYGRDSVSLDTVINGLKSKELDLKNNKSSTLRNLGEVNFVKGKSQNRFQNKKPSQNNSQNNFQYKKKGKGKTFFKPS
ncbi:hypothetical protein OROGR_022275 [Orobanche gracilis]